MYRFLFYIRCVKLSNVLRIKYDLKTTIWLARYVLPKSLPNLAAKIRQTAYSKFSFFGINFNSTYINN